MSEKKKRRPFSGSEDERKITLDPSTTEVLIEAEYVERMIALTKFIKQLAPGALLLAGNILAEIDKEYLGLLLTVSGFSAVALAYIINNLESMARASKKDENANLDGSFSPSLFLTVSMEALILFSKVYNADRLVLQNIEFIHLTIFSQAFLVFLIALYYGLPILKAGDDHDDTSDDCEFPEDQDPGFNATHPQ